MKLKDKTFIDNKRSKKMKKIDIELYEAIEYADYKKVQKLIAAGADVNMVDENSDTPLMVAACDGLDRIVKILIAAGADVNASASCGWSPLMYAIMNRHGASVKLLIEAGANVNITDTDGDTPLLLASDRYPCVVESLIKAGATQ